MPYIATEYSPNQVMTPVANATIANWNSGVATSGLAGGDLVTIGANNVKHILQSLLVNISTLTGGASITVRMYQQINGTERLVYNQTFIQGTDPNGLWVIDGSLGIHEALRVEVLSSAAGDDGASIAYDYLIE